MGSAFVSECRNKKNPEDNAEEERKEGRDWRRTRTCRGLLEGKRFTLQVSFGLVRVRDGRPLPISSHSLLLSLPTKLFSLGTSGVSLTASALSYVGVPEFPGAFQENATPCHPTYTVVVFSEWHPAPAWLLPITTSTGMPTFWLLPVG